MHEDFEIHGSFLAMAHCGCEGRDFALALATKMIVSASVRSISHTGGCSPMKTAQFAKLLKITERRVRQMADEGTLVMKGRSIEAIPSLLKLLDGAKQKSKTRAGREQLVAAQVAGARIRAERTVKKFLTVEELSDVIGIFLDQLAAMAQAESSLLYSEISGEFTEAMAREVAGRFHRRAMGIFDGARNGTRMLTETIVADHLNDRSRIADVLRKFIPNAGTNDDDQGDEAEQGEGEKEGSAEEATGRKKRTSENRRGDSGGAESAKAVKAKR